MDGVHTEGLRVDDTAEINSLTAGSAEVTNLVTSCITHTGSATLTGSIFLSTTASIRASKITGSIYSNYILPYTIARTMFIGSTNAPIAFYGSIHLVNTNNYDNFYSNQYTYSGTSTMSTAFGESIICTGIAYLFDQFNILNSTTSTGFYRGPVNGRLLSKVTFPSGLTASYAYLYASHLFSPIRNQLSSFNMTMLWRQVKSVTVYPYLNYTTQPEGVTPEFNMFPSTISTSVSIVQNVAPSGVYTIPFHQGAPCGLTSSTTSTTIKTVIYRRGDLAPANTALLFNIPTTGSCNISSDSYVLFDVEF